MLVLALKVICFALLLLVPAYHLEVFVNLPVVEQSRSALRITTASLALVSTHAHSIIQPLGVLRMNSNASVETQAAVNVVARASVTVCLWVSYAIAIHILVISSVQGRSLLNMGSEY